MTIAEALAKATKIAEIAGSQFPNTQIPSEDGRFRIKINVEGGNWIDLIWLQGEDIIIDCSEGASGPAYWEGILDRGSRIGVVRSWIK